MTKAALVEELADLRSGSTSAVPPLEVLEVSLAQHGPVERRVEEVR